MKKYLSLATALIVFAACKGTSPVVEDYQTPDDQVATPEPVKFGSNVSNLEAKAQGPLDAFTAAQSLYILGYVRAAEVDYTNAFINNVQATSPVGNGAIDVLNPDNNDEPFYYSSTNAYDFYGYYVDDAADAADLISTQTEVYINITIDGTQDVMIASADPQADIDAAKAKYAEDEEKLAKVNQVTARDAYSGYAARRYVHPTLKFSHQLTRFNYKVVPMTADAQNIKITSIKMADCNTEARLNIAGAVAAGISNVSTPASLALCKKTGDDLVEITPEDPVSVEDTAVGESLTVGAGIMVMPQESYNLNMTFDQTGAATGNTEEFALTPALIAGGQATAFEAGKQYTVTIKLYGFQKVEISVELTPWEDGGEIIIDEDKPIE